MMAAKWGATQFAPMLLVYRDLGGLSEQVAGMFAAYVGGLIPPPGYRKEFAG